MASIIKKLINGILSDVIQLEHSAQDIDDSITKTSQLTGRNLLDNWYFADPVNQRGNTEYTAIRYTIDRWYFATSGQTAALVDGAIKLSAGSDTLYFNQKFDVDLLGKYVTISVLTDSGLYSETGKFPDNYPAESTSVATVVFGTSRMAVSVSNIPESYSGHVSIAVQPNNDLHVVAAKLELGTRQTLARKAVDGTWVLIDPPPNKAEELAKCQRYFYRKKGTDSYSNYGNGYINSANGAFIFINVPEMRVAPTVAASGNFRLSTPGTAISVTSISSGGASTNGFYRISASAANSLTSNTPVWLQANNDVSTYIDFSADL